MSIEKIKIILALKINHEIPFRAMQLFDLMSKRKTKIYKKVEKNPNEDLNKIGCKNLSEDCVFNS